MTQMDAERIDIKKLLSDLDLEEKMRMLSGDGMWHNYAAGELPEVRMSDGPNGIRMTEDSSLAALPSVCYPTLGMLANSWDPALVYNIGAALGREATAMGVNLLLAPGVNIKRNPLCGRNFEYFSEDPYLAGTLGKAYIQGVQSTGVGACVKHFAANNQESHRMYSDSIVDERTLRELYLKPFELLMEAEPAAVMCAYNKLNGEQCAESEFLLKKVLRDDWHYRGVTVSDWGAVRDRGASLAAGLDLEMPDSLGIGYDSLAAALADGRITESDIDAATARILELTDNVYLEPYGDYDSDAHDKLSYAAAVDSIVLLKNDSGFLPLTKDMRVAVLGEKAASEEMQGGGSSHVTPLKSLTPLDALDERAISYTYGKGYSPDKKENARLYDEAMSLAVDADAVIVYVGAPTPSEGVDRSSIDLPPEQDALISGLVGGGHRVVVVLASQGPVRMPWAKRVRSILYSGLCGQNGALAAVDVLYGRVNPRGRLAETFPVDESELGSDFGGSRVLYRESLFVGYKYYDAIKRRTLFPFGHGLSFSEVDYGAMHAKRLDGSSFDVTVQLTNNSVRDAYETVQVYVSDRTSRVLRPEKQLVGFIKVFIEGKTSTTATVRLDRRAFEFWNTQKQCFSLCDGEYKIMVGASSGDIKSEMSVKITGDFTERIEYPDAYKMPIRSNITDADFAALLGHDIPTEQPPQKKGEFTLGNTLDDMRHCLVAKIAISAAKKQAKAVAPIGSVEYQAFMTAATQTPLCAVAAMSNGAVSVGMAKGIVEMANGHFFKGIKLMLSKSDNNR